MSRRSIGEGRVTGTGPGKGQCVGGKSHVRCGGGDGQSAACLIDEDAPGSAGAVKSSSRRVVSPPLETVPSEKTRLVCLAIAASTMLRTSLPLPLLTCAKIPV